VAIYAKQTQSCLAEALAKADSKMAITLAKTRNYDNEQRTMNYELLFKNKPNQTQPVVSLSNLFYPPLRLAEICEKSVPKYRDAEA
jgi:hypothetical protein